MVLKKNPHLELDPYRQVFFTLGLVISMGLLVLLFEWKTPHSLISVELGELETQSLVMEDIDIPSTVQPPPPPKTILEQPQIIEVQNEEEIIKDIEINLDIEMSETTVPKKSIYGDDLSGIAQVPEAPPIIEKEEEIFLIVEEKPSPVGGMEAFYEYIADNLEYPSAALQSQVSGRVFIQFVIEKDGRLSDFKVVKGIGFNCDEEALRVLKKAPKWKPGKQRGVAVRVRMTIPIFFKLLN